MTLEHQEQVIVKVKCRIERNEVAELYAARIQEFGLTGYGSTEEEALSDCKLLFRRFIRAYRKDGKLTGILNGSGVQWYPREEYPEGELDPEDTNELFANQERAGMFPALSSGGMDYIYIGGRLQCVQG